MRKPFTFKAKLTANNDIVEANSIEEEMRIAESTKIPIKATSPDIFTARKDGVLAETNIRTDRFEIAMNAMDKVSKSFVAKRLEQIEKQKANTGTDSTTTTQE